MSDTGSLLVVLADGEHMRFVRPDRDHVLHSVTLEDSILSHKRASDLGSDRPGAAFHSNAVAHHALEPRHDPKALAKERFAVVVAEQVNAAQAKGAFHQLVLVAPAHTLSAIRNSLNPASAACIVGTLAKDLVKVPDHELGPHLTQWITPKRHIPPYESPAAG